MTPLELLIIIGIPTAAVALVAWWDNARGCWHQPDGCVDPAGPTTQVLSLPASSGLLPPASQPAGSTEPPDRTGEGRSAAQP